MSIETPNLEQPRQEVNPENIQEVQKEYQLERLGTGWKALLAVEAGLITGAKELFKIRFGEEEPSATKIFTKMAEKGISGWKSIEATETMADDQKFGEISQDYNEKIESAQTPEEKVKIQSELQTMSKSREKKLTKENNQKMIRDKILEALFK